MFGGHNNYVILLPAFIASSITTGDITTRLLLCYNAGNISSNSGTGSIWYVLIENNNRGALPANGSAASPIFANGSFVFNLSRFYVRIESSVFPNTGSSKVSTWAKASWPIC